MRECAAIFLSSIAPFLFVQVKRVTSLFVMAGEERISNTRTPAHNN
jgi:hypothetical protein